MFSGVWAKQFDPKNTIKGIFLNEGQKAYAKEVDFMTMLDYYQYAYYPKYTEVHRRPPIDILDPLASYD